MFACYAKIIHFTYIFNFYALKCLYKHYRPGLSCIFNFKGSSKSRFMTRHLERFPSDNALKRFFAFNAQNACDATIHPNAT